MSERGDLRSRRKNTDRSSDERESNSASDVDSPRDTGYYKSFDSSLSTSEPAIKKIFCIHCGKKILDISKFCPHCGKRVPELSLESDDSEAESSQETRHVRGISKKTASEHVRSSEPTTRDSGESDGNGSHSKRQMSSSVEEAKTPGRSRPAGAEQPVPKEPTFWELMTSTKLHPMYNDWRLLVLRYVLIFVVLLILQSWYSKYFGREAREAYRRELLRKQAEAHLCPKGVLNCDALIPHDLLSQPIEK